MGSENFRPKGKRSIADIPALSIGAYCLGSITMTLTNKYVVSGYKFNMNFLLLMIQCSVCVIAITILKQLRIITFRDFNLREAKLWSPIAFILVAMTYTSSKALQFLSIPVYTIFKNLTIILIAYGEVIWFGGKVTSLALFSFFLMVLSSVIAAWSDVKSILIASTESVAVASSSSQANTYNIGYFWMFVNCFFSAAFVLIVRKRIKLTGFKDFDTMFYNNLLSVPILIICSFLLEDWSKENLLVNFPLKNRNALLSAMVFSGIASAGISYTSAWCIRATSSTTYSMVGALNKLPIALSGLIFFDVPVTFASVTAILVGFLAGLVYAVAKRQQKDLEVRINPEETLLPVVGNRNHKFKE